MSAFGGFTVFKITGEPDLPGFLTETITRPNVAGVAFRTNGKRGEEFELIVEVDAQNATTVATALANIKALQGSIISFTNDRGTVYANYLCIVVKALPVRPLIGSVGGVSGDGATYWITWRITLQYTLAS